jgi:predicted TIM-barrel fold metal-dependent hydrolase
VNLPAPRSDYPAYNEEIYEPLWSACEALELALVTHGGGGDAPLGFQGPGGVAVHAMETIWLSRRGLWELIFGGVFERHPGLHFVITENRDAWVKHTLSDMDYVRWMRMPELPRSPSEYWAQSCYIAGSFMAPWEAELRHEIGVDNFMWGRDYPHVEGTWPDSRLALRNTFCQVPEPEVRKILGENAVRAYYLNEKELFDVADRIGPTPDEISAPLEAHEYPRYRGPAFRQFGTIDAATLTE